MLSWNEYIEELLTILLDGIQDKKDYLDSVCEKYMKLEDVEAVKSEFVEIIEDIALIFDKNLMPMKKMRFKQKSDFYSLFACVAKLKKEHVLCLENLPKVRALLIEVDKNVGTQSEDELYREYATRCLSDANSIANRKWRIEFLETKLMEAYCRKE